MRIFVFVLLYFINIFAQELKVVSDSFESDQKLGKSIFIGNVYVKKGEDELFADKLIVWTDKKNKPIKFEAEGDVKFKLQDNDKNSYAGKSKRVIYYPDTKTYKFYGDVYLKQLNENKEIKGEKVFLDLTTSKASAEGKDDKPVIIKFDIDEKKKK